MEGAINRTTNDKSLILPIHVKVISAIKFIVL